MTRENTDAAPLHEDDWSEMERLARASIDFSAVEAANQRLGDEGPAPYNDAVNELRRVQRAFVGAAGPATILKLIASARSAHEGEGEPGNHGEAYQVIGAIASAAGLFDHPDVQRALDYFADPSGEILPFSIAAPPPSVEVERLREALRPFALAAENMDGDEPDTLFIYDSPESAMIDYGDLRRARAALSRKQEPGVPTPGGEGK